LLIGWGIKTPVTLAGPFGAGMGLRQISSAKKIKHEGKQGKRKGVKDPVSMRKIIGSVAEFYGQTAKDIQKARRGKGIKNTARWVAMNLCQEVGGARLTDIANAFHVGHYSTVSQTIGRLNRLMEIDRQVVRDFNVLSQDLTP
jgi:chromosomal replication initiation ATPase DnaA